MVSGSCAEIENAKKEVDNMSEQIVLKNYNVAIVSTTLIYKSEEMAEWIKARCNDFALVTISSHYAKNLESSCKYYEKDKLKKSFNLLAYHHKIKSIDPAFFLPINLFIHFSSVCYAFFRLRKSFDICIAIGYFDVLIALILKKMGFFKRVVYYSGDYFRNYEQWDWRHWFHCLRTWLFQTADKIIVKSADAVWNDTFSMIEVRKEKKISIPTSTPQLVVPLGLNLQDKPLIDRSLNTHDVIFIGNLQEYQGLMLFLEAMPQLIKKIPDIKLHVIGSGSYELELKNKVASEKLDDYVQFYGFVKSEKEIEEILSKCVLAIAPYDPGKSSFIKYVNAGKVKEYLCNGLPVIMTRVSETAKKVEEAKAGVIIDYTKEDIIKAVVNLLKDKKLLAVYAKNAKILSQEYSWAKLCERAFGETFRAWGWSNKGSI